MVRKILKGDVHVYFGHICDRIWVSGDTLEDFYAALEKEYRFTGN